MLGGRIDLEPRFDQDIYQDAFEDKWYTRRERQHSERHRENARRAADDSSRIPPAVCRRHDGRAVPQGACIIRGEANAIRAERIGTGENNTSVKMIGLGILMMKQRFQPFIRFDQQRGDPFVRGGRTDITYVA